MASRRIPVSSPAASPSRRPQRLLQLYLTLAGGSTVTAAELARAARVTERTIYRDIDTLRASGLPLKGSAGVGYRLEEPFEVAPLLLTRAELRALLAGTKALKGGAAEPGRAVQTLLAKALAVSRRG